MVAKPQALKPQDIVVALRLAVAPDTSYLALGSDLSMSPSTAHESVERLQLAGLLRPESRHINRHCLLEFLEHGVRYAFPTAPGPRTRGVPTAWSAPVFASKVVADDIIVWPDPQGSAIGEAIAPLASKAENLPARCPEVYDLLALVDAIRVGRVRERARAMEKISERLKATA